MSEPDDNAPDFESEGVNEIDLNALPTELGILPLRDTLLFPRPSCRSRWHARAPSPWSTRRCASANLIGVVTQRDPAVDDPVESDLFPVGALTHIHKMFKFPDGSLRLVVQGVQRFRVLQVPQYRRS